MKTPQAIVACEKSYIGFIAEREELPYGARYRDDMLPGLFEYNFTYLAPGYAEEELPAILLTELEWSRKQGKCFCNIVTDLPLGPVPDLEGLSPPVRTVMGYYVFDLKQYEGMRGAKDAELRIVNSADRARDITVLDILTDRSALGEDFCRRRAQRRISLFLSDSPINSYVCYRQGEPVGSCDLSVVGATARLEELSVVESMRRKGYGTAILRELIGRALDCGVSLIYLVTDEADTPEAECRKLGFTKAGERTGLLYRL